MPLNLPLVVQAILEEYALSPDGDHGVDYQHCHRRLLSDYLLANDVTVQHILSTGDVKPHRLTAGAKIVDGTVTYPGQPTLFDL